MFILCLFISFLNFSYSNPFNEAARQGRANRRDVKEYINKIEFEINETNRLHSVNCSYNELEPESFIRKEQDKILRNAIVFLQQTKSYVDEMKNTRLQVLSDSRQEGATTEGKVSLLEEKIFSFESTFSKNYKEILNDIRSKYIIKYNECLVYSKKIQVLSDTLKDINNLIISGGSRKISDDINSNILDLIGASQDKIDNLNNVITYW